MGIKRTYIQQVSFDGKNYTKGKLIDTLADYKILCVEFPFMLFPEAKELPTRDWAGEDGTDVYVPESIPLASYEVEVEFVYSGSENTMRKDLGDFLAFLYGKNEGATGARLLVYDEATQTGRKDVRVKSVDNEVYYDVEYDNEQVAKFKVKFSVDDPSTNVNPVISQGKVVELNICER